jgi:transcriptional regulator with XRE-family HTH domain
MIERQENSPTEAMLERIAQALGIEPARLAMRRRRGGRGSSVRDGARRSHSFVA